MSRFLEQLESFLQEEATLVFEETNEPKWLLTVSEGLQLKVFRDCTVETCTQCRLAAFQNHPVPLASHHFIVCGDKKDPSLNDQICQKDDGKYASYSHLLHAVIHTNGYGHLLRVNQGFNNGYHYSGSQLVNFWEGLCNKLNVCSISIEDISHFNGMLLRVIEPIYKGRTWYGHWGYDFRQGACNIKQRDWVRAARFLRNTQMEDLKKDYASVDDTIVKIIDRYSGEGKEKPHNLGEWLMGLVNLSRDKETAMQFEATGDLKKAELDISLMSAESTDSKEDEEQEKAANKEEDEGEGEGEEVILESNEKIVDSVTMTEIHPSPGAAVEEPPKTEMKKEEEEEIIVAKKIVDKLIPHDLSKSKLDNLDPSLFTSSKRGYSARRLLDGLRIVLSVLLSYEGGWVRQPFIRTDLYRLANDRVLIDFILGVVSNKRFNGYAIHKVHSKKACCFYFLFEKDETQLLDNEHLFRIGLPQLSPSGYTCAPGNPIVSGTSLKPFEKFLASLYQWLCETAKISIGRGPNKISNKRKLPPIGSGGGSHQNKNVKKKLHKITSIKDLRKTFKNYFALLEKTEPWRYKEENLELEKAILNLSTNNPCGYLDSRRQISLDLLYFYKNVMHCYKPAFKKDGTYRDCLLPKFPFYVQALEDVKIYMKDFRGGSLLPFICSEGSVDYVDIIVNVNFPERPNSKQFKNPERQIPRFILQGPPPELIRVNSRSAPERVMESISTAFSKIYKIFQNGDFEFTNSLDYVDGKLKSRNVIVEPVNYEKFKKYRYVGGTPDYIDCICGSSEDDGFNLVECSFCNFWMHVRCSGYMENSYFPDDFLCQFCQITNKKKSSNPTTVEEMQ